MHYRGNINPEDEDALCHRTVFWQTLVLCILNHLNECSQGMNWCEVFTERLMLSGKNKTNLLENSLKREEAQNNVDLEERILGFSGVKSRVSKRVVVTDVTLKISSF